MINAEVQNPTSFNRISVMLVILNVQDEFEVLLVLISQSCELENNRNYSFSIIHLI